MTSTRRKFLTLIGGGTVLAATAATGFVTTRTPTKALAPWEAAGGYDDPRKHALSYAILAPNPHNRQPWQVRLDGDDTVTVFRDPTLDLPETDPFSRQLTIGMGCFLEQMRIAASANGYQTDMKLFPDGEDETAPVARITFREGATPDPLAAHIMDRRSCKEPFDMTRPVKKSDLAPLAVLNSPKVGLGTATDDPMVSTIRDLAWAAWETEMFTPPKLKESTDLIRLGKREINAQPDGIDLGGPFLESLMLAGLLTRDGLSEVDSVGFQGTIDSYTTMMNATPAYAWLTTPGNTRTVQIHAGAAWLRLNLTTTALGLSLHPVSQCLQEYAEMEPHYAAAHSILAKPGETVQMLGRLGYGPEVPVTPRWPLETKLLNA